MAFQSPTIFPTSLISSIRKTDYSKWQRSNVAQKSALKLNMPPISAPKDLKKDGGVSSPEKPKEKKIEWATTAKAVVRMMPPLRQKSTWNLNMTKEMIRAKRMENIKIIQRFIKHKTHSLEEIKRHSNFLLEKNRALMEEIKEMDADTVIQARGLLQQYDMFRTVIRTLRDSSQNQVGVAKADLAAAEKMVEKNLGKLDQEMKRMQAKVHVLQEELNILKTYMDKEYPVKAVQIASLMRSVRNLNEEQQDELEEMEDMFKKYLESMATKARAERERYLQHVTEKKLMEYQDGLHQMDKNNLVLRIQIAKQKEVIDGLVKDVTALHKNLILLHHSTGDPREVIFTDVLLRRPKCPPDMDIVLNIPTDEDFPL
ncbi:uncharacterized protein C20orf96 homolog [Zootoca vivipara]|uniref:uncharacterized protein C20orf96 homolog n=1 Tax=Zootoca vivipara TaxID=8524 RepID=UPI00293BFE1A|nr:uncharacterized protein C20orf96 homolog [Zootoca vivipara]